MFPGSAQLRPLPEIGTAIPFETMAQPGRQTGIVMRHEGDWHVIVTLPENVEAFKAGAAKGLKVLFNRGQMDGPPITGKS